MVAKVAISLKLCYNHRMNFTDEHEPSSLSLIERVEQVEALPHSRAFEHVMYDNRLSRSVRYDMQRSFSIHESLMQTQFPEELRDIFPDKSYIIEQLQAEQVEDRDSAYTDVSFLANGTKHRLHSEDGHTIYETKNIALEEVRYTLSLESILGLLATFTYAQQFDKAELGSSIELSENNLMVLRDPQVSLTEQIIMTLGNHDGVSCTETTAIFEGKNGTPIVAKLREQEKPHLSSLHNNLELTQLQLDDATPETLETTIYQKVVDASAIRVEAQYAERQIVSLESGPVDVPELIDPEQNYDEWSHICDEFLSSIQNELDIYRYLDE